MGYYCTVPQCTSLAGKTKNVKFHRFPRDESMADRWNMILKRGKPYTKYSKVCSLHFTQGDYNVTTMGQWKTLSKDAVPSQNLPKLNPDGSVMVIRKSRTVKYREGGRKEGKDSFEIKQEPKWSTMMSAVMQQCEDPHDVAYRLQTLSAIASTLSPQPPHTPHPLAASTPSSSHHHHNGPKPKKQDAFMQTDPVHSDGDDTMPNNSYSEASDTSYNSSEHIEYPYNKDKDPLSFNPYQKDKEYLAYPKDGQDRPYTEQGKDYPNQGKDYPNQGKDYPSPGKEYDSQNQGKEGYPQDKDYTEQGKDYLNQGKDYPEQGKDYPDQGKDYPNKDYPSASQGSQEKYNSEKYSSIDKNYTSQESAKSYQEQGKDYPSQGKDYPSQGKDYPSQSKDYPSPKDYTSSKDDFMPQTNEEYNKEAEKYALERKSHNSYEKITPETYQKNLENGYQGQKPENFQKPPFHKPDNPFQKPETVNPFQKPENPNDPFRKLDNPFQKTGNPFQKADELFRKPDNPFQKPDSGYQKITDMYPNYEKDYQRPEYYQNGYQDSVGMLRNQQQNLEMLQHQRQDPGYFNENHIKQELDLNSEEEKFMYERTKDQLADASMYGGGARSLSQQRLLEHLQHQLKREPGGGGDPLMQPDGSPYYTANGHNNIPGGYYGEMGRPGPELLIAKQNALAHHTQLWQNSMKRPFFYSDNPHYTGPQLIHRYEPHTLPAVRSTESVVYRGVHFISPGVKTNVLITHGFNAQTQAIMTKVTLSQQYGTKPLVVLQANSDHIVKAIGQTNYETVMSSLLKVPNKHAKVQAIIALLRQDKTGINKGKEKSCQTNESALREIDATKLQLLRRNKYNKNSKKKPYVVTDKHIEILDIGQKMNESLSNNNMKTMLDTSSTDFETNDSDEPLDDSCSDGKASLLTNFTASSGKVDNEMKLLTENINQVTKTDGTVSVPNLSGQNLFATDIVVQNDANVKKLNGFEQAFVNSVQPAIDCDISNAAALEMKQKRKEEENKIIKISRIARQPKFRTELSQTSPITGRTSLIIGQTSNSGHILPNTDQTSFNFCQTQPSIGQIVLMCNQNSLLQAHNSTAVSNYSFKPSRFVQNQPNFGKNPQNFLQNQLNVKQTQVNFGQHTPNTGQNLPIFVQTQSSLVGQYQPNTGQNPPNVVQTQSNLVGQYLPNTGRNLPNSSQTQLHFTQNTVNTHSMPTKFSLTMQNRVQNNMTMNNGHIITMSDGYEITIPYKEEDDDHIATLENLKELSPGDRRKLVLHQAYIDFKRALTMDDGYYPIHQAVRANDIEWLKRQYYALRMKGTNVDELSSHGMTALHMSVYCVTSSCCTTLIQLGADPLIAHDEGRNILHIAAERGADGLADIINTCGARARAIVCDHVEEMQELLSGSWSSRNDEELRVVLMEHLNTRVDDQGYTPLMLASRKGLYENVRILLECQSQPERTVDCYMPTCGDTALHLAVKAVCSDCQENSNMSVIAENLSKTIECLIENGADLEFANYAGFTPNSLAQDTNISGLNLLLSKLNSKKYNLSQDSLMFVKNSKSDKTPKDNDKPSDIKPQQNLAKVNKKLNSKKHNLSQEPLMFVKKRKSDKSDNPPKVSDNDKNSVMKPKQKLAVVKKSLIIPKKYNSLMRLTRNSVKASLQDKADSQNLLRKALVQSKNPDNKTQNENCNNTDSKTEPA